LSDRGVAQVHRVFRTSRDKNPEPVREHVGVKGQTVMLDWLVVGELQELLDCEVRETAQVERVFPGQKMSQPWRFFYQQGLVGVPAARVAQDGDVRMLGRV